MAEDPTSASVTELLHASRSGRKDALDQVIPLVYEQLRAIASRELMFERADHTLRPTGLVHEVYVRLVNADISFADRAHFYAIATKLVRRILIDYAKAQRREKRGGGAARVTFDEALAYTGENAETILAIDEALQRLSALDRRQADIIELLFFGGVQQDFAAEALGISPATLRRDLRLAKAWLYNELRPTHGDT